MLAVVLIAKHMHGRPRPVVHPPAKRMVDLRTKETNCSFPSGDAAQGALFAFFLAYHYPYLYIALQEWVFILKFVAMVSIGRVPPPLPQLFLLMSRTLNKFKCKMSLLRRISPQTMEVNRPRNRRGNRHSWLRSRPKGSTL